MIIDHIAVLTTDLRRQSDALPAFCHKQAIESFPEEGTMEQYVEITEQSPKLLLLQAIAAGPYARALAKRGPGLHHLGVKTLSLKALIPSISAQGLLMHPISIQTLEQGVAWLCRPGLPFLIELSEGKVEAAVEPFELGLPTGYPIPDVAAQLFSNAHIYQASTDCLEWKAGTKLMQIPLL
ncbi:MAG: hypothetical protein CVV27_08540 [Candidatus Melainabacteria bacterium HGW-Melainabacteria-1]|nr:MAG: hypothetical protein CVV27_08540 [Candidatus Melainabacteria bacterium HGW-Melainabacteria-1]